MSGITAVNDFEAELLLNKIMNGQVRVDNGRTVSAANRAKSTSLDIQGIEAATKAGDVAAHVPALIEQQSILTNILNVATQLKKELAANPATTITGVLLGKLADLVTMSTDAKLGSQNLDIGLTLTGSGTPPADGFATTDHAAVLGTAITTEALLDAHIALLGDALAASAADIKIVNNASSLLKDLADSYTQAGSRQTSVSGFGSTGLLNSILA